MLQMSPVPIRLYYTITLLSENWANLLIKWKVHENLSTSDHRPILVEMGRTSVTTCHIQPRYNCQRANWKKYGGNVNKAVKEIRDIRLNCKMDINRLVIRITQMLHEAAQKTIPRKKRFQKSVPWWSRDLNEAKKQMNRARKAYQREQDQYLKRERNKTYKTCRQYYSKEVRKARKLSWINFVETQSKGNPYSVIYRMANNKMQAGSVASNIEKPDGTFTTDWTETAEQMLEGLFGPFHTESSMEVRDLESW